MPPKLRIFWKSAKILSSLAVLRMSTFSVFDARRNWRTNSLARTLGGVSVLEGLSGPLAGWTAPEAVAGSCWVMAGGGCRGGLSSWLTIASRESCLAPLMPSSAEITLSSGYVAGITESDSPGGDDSKSSFSGGVVGSSRGLSRSPSSSDDSTVDDLPRAIVDGVASAELDVDTDS